MIPVYINVRDFGSPAMLMVEYLRQIPEARPILVDNASTWPPLVEWLDRAPCEVIRLNENLGPRAALTIVEQTRNGAPFYVITDPDLDLSAVPLDVLDVLRAGLDQWPQIGKVGLSLEIADIPAAYPFRDRVLAVEQRFWAQRRGAYLDQSTPEAFRHRRLEFWEADIDTSFAMLRAGEPYPAYGPALRADRPYTARHVPWYITPDNATPEYRWYLSHLGHKGGLYWSTLADDSKAFA